MKRSWTLGLAVTLGACGPAVAVGDAGTETGTSSGAPGTTSSSSTTSATSSSSSGEPGSSEGDASSSTTGPGVEGPGCGAPPPCDRGTFEGHIRIESEADLAQIEGFSRITGVLEIMNSDDLVCLDTLACLEEVGRDVRIQSNAALRSTEGLLNLNTVGTAGANRPYVFVSDNESLETLSLRLGSTIGRLVLWRNPQLVEVAEGPKSRGWPLELVVLENPSLESLGWLREPPQGVGCLVNRNPRLCSEEVAGCTAVSTLGNVFHGAECPEGPPEPFAYDPKGSRECSLGTHDCPDGEKCIAYSEAGDDRTLCVPLVASPRQLGEPCDEGEEPWDAVDDCELMAFCAWDGSCRSVGFGGYEFLTCPNPEGMSFVAVSGYERGCLSLCDPLASNCQDGWSCQPVDSGFVCVPNAGNSGVWEACEAANECQDGLVCMNADLSTNCDGSSPGCCAPACNVDEPLCPDGATCEPWFAEDAFPNPVVEHVGICIGA